MNFKTPLCVKVYNWVNKLWGVLNSVTIYSEKDYIRHHELVIIMLMT